MTGAKPKLNGQPGPRRLIDLNAARAARAEAQSEPVTLVIGDATLILPAEMPADFALLGQQGRLREAVVALVGHQAEEFFAQRPSMPDIEALCEAAAEVYGVNTGESEASP